jgi:hypothetical protein
VDLRKLLETLNRRIAYLFDRDHTLGHAYFINIKTFADLEHCLLRKVIPLLQEYFFEDWSKIRLVLGDEQKKLQDPIVRKSEVNVLELFGSDAEVSDGRVNFEVAKEADPGHGQGHLRMSLVSFREYERIPVVEVLSSATERAFSVAEINQLDGLAARLRIPVIEHLVAHVGAAGAVRGRGAVGKPHGGVPAQDRAHGGCERPPGGAPQPVANAARRLRPGWCHARQAALEKSNDGWLDLLMRLFCRALADQLRRGLIRRYREECDDCRRCVAVCRSRSSSGGTSCTGSAPPVLSTSLTRIMR